MYPLRFKLSNFILEVFDFDPKIIYSNLVALMSDLVILNENLQIHFFTIQFDVLLFQLHELDHHLLSFIYRAMLVIQFLCAELTN